MNHFAYHDHRLYCEDVPLEEIAARVGTPFYCYSEATLRRHFLAFDRAITVPHLTCFAVKACSNIAILNLFAGLGGGADIVSGGELFRATRAGVPAERIVYSGVGKTTAEIRAALEAGILLFNVESEQELAAVARVAEDLGKRAPVALRINPDVDPKTHAYISTGLAKNKFGIPVDTALELYRRAAADPRLLVRGVSCHIGSQLTQLSPFLEALDKVKGFIGRLAGLGISVDYLDLGGGLGITYRDEEPPPPEEYGRALAAAMADLRCTLLLEPGRVIVGNAGVLVSRVLYTKQGGTGKHFTVVDAAMNDLARPSLYGAYHGILPVHDQGRQPRTTDVVGPICETGDFLAREADIPALEPGELLAVASAGAYGFSMASNYNSRPRPAEVLVRGGDYFVIRRRETYEDLVRGEEIPDPA